PNLDRMAREGLRLTSLYSASPVCTPSRAALMTGRYAARMGAERMHLANVLVATDKEGLPKEETTVASALKTRRYATACIGKWHLGVTEGYRAVDRGFDYYFGIPYSNDMTPSVLLRGTEKIEEPVRQDTLTMRYTQESIGFIERSSDRPFFLYLAHTMPHRPLHASKGFRGRSPAGLYGDAVEEVDWSVGEVLSAIRRLTLERDTLVAFSSDNGPWNEGSPGPLRGRKGSTYEGGVRVPGIFRWPEHIRARSVSDEPACTLDFYPTAAALAGIPELASAGTRPLDGRSILPFLVGRETRLPDRLLLFFDTVYLQTARFGHWKIHVARWRVPRYVPGYSDKNNAVLKNPELYDMTVDPSESYDLAADRSEVVRDIRMRIAEALKTFPQEIRDANRDLMEGIV
ncbi:MAG: sulfatase, partial [Spirochaetes bacterium]|nr:sulfatase [Spirochaetota bacterium]